MWNILKFYNQNRFKIWVGVLILVFLILITHTLNNMTKQENKISQTDISAENTEKDYTSQSQSIITGDRVGNLYSQSFGKLIDNFLGYCKNHEPEKAYGLLAQDCKEILYPTEQVFEEKYYQPKFSQEKTYTFQSWSSSGSYIYLVKIYPNMLSTGSGSLQGYIQDYISVIKESDTYKLNVSSFVGISKKNLESTIDGITIKINYTEVYMDYEIANVTVNNNTSSNIILDSRNKTDTVYLEDRNNIKFEAMLFENEEDDLNIQSNQEKQIKIKFSHPYQAGNTATKYVFSDVRDNTRDIKTIILEK